MSGISGVTGTQEPQATRVRRRGRQQEPPPSDSSGGEDDFEEVEAPEKEGPREKSPRRTSTSAKGSKAADKVKQKGP